MKAVVGFTMHLNALQIILIIVFDYVIVYRILMYQLQSRLNHSCPGRPDVLLPREATQ